MTHKIFLLLLIIFILWPFDANMNERNQTSVMPFMFHLDRNHVACELIKIFFLSQQLQKYELVEQNFNSIF